MSLSERLYGLLLRCYPAAYRRRYGGDMRIAFRDLYVGQIRSAPPTTKSKLWA